MVALGIWVFAREVGFNRWRYLKLKWPKIRSGRE
jgi:hypothetical protein